MVGRAGLGEGDPSGVFLVGQARMGEGWVGHGGHQGGIVNKALIYW